MRRTKQRALVADALGTDEMFRSAQDIYNSLRARDENVGLTTVYRTLQAFVDTGDVDTLRTDDGETLYRRCSRTEHHHHLVCRSCGRTVELRAADVEAWAVRVAKRHGFSDVTHTVEVFGTCERCR